MLMRQYEDSLKAYRDIKNSLDTAEEKGRAEVAKKLLAMGLTIQAIAEATGLAEDEIKKL